MYNNKYQYDMEASCTYHLPSTPSCSTWAIQCKILENFTRPVWKDPVLSKKYWRILQDLYEKTLSLAKNTGEFYAKKSGEQTIRGEKKTRQKEQLNWVK